ncbi:MULTISPECIES: type I-E CRISPR-associated protein Cas7/Cse4/CasC [Thiorhodovibrio]|uniref:type I-E CRISPR-associated protein Cas7/Cse4/CasC n=1 Tax=Thiorhodovibrio TaxID=61593 RepID=UPI001913A503|nr:MULTISPECIES: type I-E CRISPR-associated protein Cas7/Cse4/CasC [Thiorhodovibrio]MBK5969330.1 type I-E CRISPR-associated protein Cas7/Cse4/CasC [Thiorhodovibrio winogradskyi]WPL13667.1 CRISPR system Cascade subunit CasC [Thiorhodovibrio litoralis]
MTNQPRFIQIHTLHSYPAALINRDDAGLAKRLPLGNATRTRISSQCLKRHWRIAEDRFALSALKVPMAVRSRGTLEQMRKRIAEAGVAEPLALAAVEAMRDGGLVDKAGKDKKGEEALKTGQAVLMGCAEIDYLVQRCIDLAAETTEEKALRAAVGKMLKDEKKNITALKHGSGLESALFGRMVTSDVLASRDAAVYVAHAFTVHEAQVENDYFTVVDDLLRESGELGSAGIFDTELASGLYYGYVVVDVPQLVENLEAIKRQECFDPATPPEKRALAGQVVEHLLHLMATVSPGAKRGSTAPFDWASFMLVEAGDWQPRSLAGAFHEALPAADNTAPIRQRAMDRLGKEIGHMDEAYGAPLARRFMALDPVAIPQAERIDLNTLATWTAGIIQAGAC